jgi:hypothetical protein
MTAPTQEEIRAHVEATLAGPLELAEEVQWRIGEVRDALDGFVRCDRITDEDYGVYSDTAFDDLRARMPEIEAAIRPILVDVQTEAIVAFFNHFPDAPLAKREAVPA